LLPLVFRNVLQSQVSVSDRRGFPTKAESTSLWLWSWGFWEWRWCKT